MQAVGLTALAECCIVCPNVPLFVSSGRRERDCPPSRWCTVTRDISWHDRMGEKYYEQGLHLDGESGWHCGKTLASHLWDPGFESQSPHVSWVGWFSFWLRGFLRFSSFSSLLLKSTLTNSNWLELCSGVFHGLYSGCQRRHHKLSVRPPLSCATDAIWRWWLAMTSFFFFRSNGRCNGPVVSVQTMDQQTSSAWTLCFPISDHVIP